MFTLQSAGVIFFADDARRHFARLDRDRLIDHTLLGGVVTHFNMAGQREVLAERIADETVVGQDTAQIGMTSEYKTEQIKCLALVPVGARPYIQRKAAPGNHP